MTNEEKAIELLSEIVRWWDEWMVSKEPTNMEDPPIEDARNVLMKLKSSTER